MSPDQKFTVPEPPPGIGSGFLTEYWKQEEPLPRVAGWQVVWHFLERGLQTALALPMSNTITVMTSAISLFLLAGFLLLLQNVGRVVVTAGNTFYLTAYVKEGVGEQELSEFLRELESNQRVRSVEYISKAKALENFKRDLGGKSSFLAGIENDNPLPASVDIVLRPDDAGVDAVQMMLDKLRTRTNLIDEVVYGNEWVEKMQGVLKVFRFLGAGSLLVVMVIVIFLIANTIKLVFYARRDEIGIMQLVGASEWFVKTPFIIGGMIQGLAGSVLGILMLRFAFFLFTLQIQNFSLFGVVLPELSFLSTGTICVLIFTGLLIGALGSFFSLGRFMNV